MKQKRIYQCENSIDGIFSAIYRAWSDQYGHEFVKIEEESMNNLELFSEYITVSTDFSHSEKVACAIQNKISQEAFEMVCRAGLSDARNKGDAIYRFLLIGFAHGNLILDQINHPLVYPIFQMNKKVYNESHHYLGFLHFTALDHHLLYAPFRPKSQAISLIAPHFADRLPLENWIIHDTAHMQVAIHPMGKDWFLTDTLHIPPMEATKILSGDTDITKFWHTFFQSISIKERENLSLQSQNIPKRFWEYMTELQYK